MVRFVAVRPGGVRSPEDGWLACERVRVVTTARDAGSPSSGVFVGRPDALAELDAALEAAESGQGSLVLITGDPGIGKTRLADELAVRARSRGAVVLWGTCWEGGGAPAYWPWVQVVRSWMREAGVSLADLGAHASDLAPILPEVPAGASSTDRGDSAERDRFRLFDALAEVLLRGTEGQPILVVLDDLHWADTSSLIALRFLAGEVHRAPALLVGAYRDLEIDQDRARASAIGDLARLARRLPLTGLAPAEVGRFLAITAGREPAPDVIDAVVAQTGGNPLFVREVVRLAWGQGSVESIVAGPWRSGGAPAGVREVISRRLQTLPPEARSVLEVAAVRGEEFSLEATARVAGLDRGRALGALETAVAARLVTEASGVPGRYRFAHALIGDVLYRGLPAEQAASLHGRTGEVLEEIYGDDGEHLAEIATHYLRAVPLSDTVRAVRYARLAGERAMSMLAWEEAARHFEVALDALGLDPAATSREARCDLHLQLGRARVRAGETEAARRAFLHAAGLAREMGDTARLAAAALGLGSASPVWGTDRELVELLEQARVALGDDGDAPLRARVLARLGQAQYYMVTEDVRDALSREAVEAARASRDDGALADALTARRVLWGPDDLAGRASLAVELVAVARATSDLDLEARARSWRIIDLIEAGDLSSARNEINHHGDLAGRLRQPSHIRDGVVWRAMEALLDGRFDRAGAFADEALAIGERIQDPGARAIYGVQKVMILAEEADPGRLDEAVTLARQEAQAHPDIPAWRALLAFAEARAGRLDDARAGLEIVATDAFAGVPRDAVFLVTLCHAADAAAITGHHQVARTLRPLLDSHVDRWVVIDRGLACKGSIGRLIGLLEGVLGNHQASVEHLDRALTRHARADAQAFAARNRRELASALLARDGPGDIERAASLLDEAHEAARRLGMPGLLSEIAALRPAEVSALASPEVAEGAGVVRREGEFWTLRFAGLTVRLRDVKGLHDIARLLASPGTEIHVLDLMGAAGAQRSVAAGEGIELVDPLARRAYRARLEELHQQIDEAEGANDLERAARARAEAEFLTAELSAALGLGGRPRRGPDPPERARKAVTWRIRAGIDRIARAHPELGRHLRASIRTGAFCSYAPEHPVAWRVDGLA